MRATPAAFLITAAGEGGGPHVKVYADRDNNGSFETLAGEIMAYETTFTGGVRAAAGDFNGDGNDELVTVPGPGREPLVRIFALSSSGAILGKTQEFLAFDATYTSGLTVAAGDVMGTYPAMIGLPSAADGYDDLIVGMLSGDTVVRVFPGDPSGEVMLGRGGVGNVMTLPFQAYGAFSGGVRLAAGDIDGDGTDEIITGAGPGGGPHVKTFDLIRYAPVPQDYLLVPSLRDSYFAFAGSFRGGVEVASGDIAGSPLNLPDGRDEVIATMASGGDVTLVFNASTIVHPLQPYGGFTGGVRIAAGDLNGDGFDELATGAGPGGGPHVKTYDYVPLIYNPGPPPVYLYTPAQTNSFFAYAAGFRGGVNVATATYKADAFTDPNLEVRVPTETGVGRTVGRIVVPAAAGIVRDVEVFLNLAHLNVGDVRIMLRHVNTGKVLTLVDRANALRTGYFIRVSDAATTDLAAAAGAAGQPIFGHYNPQGTATLSLFAGDDASGGWELIIDDLNDPTTFGILWSWGLKFVY